MSDYEGSDTTTVIIEDRNGNQHDWMIEAIPGGESYELLEELGILVGDSIGKAIQAAAGFIQADSIEDFAKIGFDGQALGDAITGFIMRTRKAGSQEFLFKLLNYTARDGNRFRETKNGRQLIKAASGGDGAAAGKVISFDKVAARNQKEMLLAAVEVVKWNFADFFDGSELVRLWKTAKAKALKEAARVAAEAAGTKEPPAEGSALLE